MLCPASTDIRPHLLSSHFLALTKALLSRSSNSFFGSSTYHESSLEATLHPRLSTNRSLTPFVSQVVPMALKRIKKVRYHILLAYFTQLCSSEQEWFFLSRRKSPAFFRRASKNNKSQSCSPHATFADHNTEMVNRSFCSFLTGASRPWKGSTLKLFCGSGMLCPSCDACPYAGNDLLSGPLSYILTNLFLLRFLRLGG